MVKGCLLCPAFKIEMNHAVNPGVNWIPMPWKKLGEWALKRF
jgi:hypothetical protein